MRKISYLRCTIDVNFTPILKLLAIIVAYGEIQKKKKKEGKPLILVLGHYYIVGTVKINRSDSVFVIGLEYIQTQNLLSALHIK